MNSYSVLKELSKGDYGKWRVSDTVRTTGLTRAFPFARTHIVDCLEAFSVVIILKNK